MTEGSESSQGRTGESSRRRSFFLLLVAAFVPVATLFAALLRNARAVPIFDDYPAILAFAVHFQSLATPGQQLRYVFLAQTGDYKLIFQHLLVASDLWLTHRVHFGFLIWAGNLLGFGIGWLLWRMHFMEERDPRIRFLLFLPVVFLFFQMNFVENFDWAMCGLQTFAAVFFSLLSLDLAARRSKSAAALACVCACLAGFSSSNGFLVAPFGALIFLSRRAWSRLWAWAITLALAAAVYHRGYQSLPNVFQNENTTAGNRILFFFSFLGSAVENQHRQPVKYGAVLLGVCLVAVLVASLRLRYHRQNPAATCMAGWVLLTTIPVLVYRLPAGFQYSLLMRYKIYSDLLLIFSYGFLATRLQRSLPPARKAVVYAAALSVALGFCVASDMLGYRFLVKRRERVALGLERYVRDTTQSPQISVSGDPIDPAQNERARLILTRALQTGVYQLPLPGRR